MADRLAILAELARRFGAREAVRFFVSRLASRLAAIEVHRVRLQDVASFAAGDTGGERIECRLLAPGEVHAFASDPANDISPAFAERAELGHLCFAVLLDGRLVAYTWYAIGSIEPEHSTGVALSFSADTAYAYKAYTRPEYRGVHLQARLKQSVMEGLLARGVRRRLALIEWTNCASLRTSTRSGWRDMGLLVTAGRTRRRVLARPAAALREGIRFEHAGSGPFAHSSPPR